MKKHILISLVLLIFISSEAVAQKGKGKRKKDKGRVSVEVRYERPYYEERRSYRKQGRRYERRASYRQNVRKPGKRYVWVSGYWQYNRRLNRDVWVAGYWAKPSRRVRWVPPHYEVYGRSRVWIEGAWISI